MDNCTKNLYVFSWLLILAECMCSFIIYSLLLVTTYCRCTGVEYFLTRLAKDLPDMEMKINVFDYPCTSTYHTIKSPVLSFSRVSLFIYLNTEITTYRDTNDFIH